MARDIRDVLRFAPASPAAAAERPVTSVTPAAFNIGGPVKTGFGFNTALGTQFSVGGNVTAQTIIGAGILLAAIYAVNRI